MVILPLMNFVFGSGDCFGLQSIGVTLLSGLTDAETIEKVQVSV
jgi:hypothetical protein